MSRGETVDVEPLSQEARKRIEQGEAADLVIGILAEFNHESVVAVGHALRTLPESPRVAILLDDKSLNHEPPGSGSEASETTEATLLVPWPKLTLDTAGTPMLSLATAYQSVFAACEKFGAQACCVVASKLESTGPEWIHQLVRPLLENGADLVAPRYARHKYDGLLNGSVIAPLTRCLYGKQIHYPTGPDLGLSRRLFQRMPGTDASSASAASRGNLLASLAPTALCNGLQVCEVYVGARIYPPTDWTNISSIIAQVLSPIFLDMERYAPCWQRIRTSSPVAAFGDPVSVSLDEGSVDTSRMVESFQLANRDLQEIWGLVLPPSTLVELRKLSRMPVEQFRMSDDLWVRIVYDFALGHRLRIISRDHLLKSMTPLYLAWVASFAQALGAEPEITAEQRLERLSVAFESGKPYLVSRWRWPDRFNP
jgi:glucosylglycerate synthase